MLVSAAFALFPPAFRFVSAFAHISVVMTFKPKVFAGFVSNPASVFQVA